MRSKALPLIGIMAFVLLGCQSRPLPQQCYQDPSSGRGEQSLERWYFHEGWHECRPFIWGGDDDGVVPFDDRESCRQACKPETPEKGE